MISSGGTSLVITMVVFGLLANFARREPQAAAALRGLGPRGIAAFLGVGVTMTGSTPRRVTKRRARREAKRAAAAAARLDELTASSDDYLRRPGDPGRRPPGGSARPSSIASATASAGGPPPCRRPYATARPVVRRGPVPGRHGRRRSRHDSAATGCAGCSASRCQGRPARAVRLGRRVVAILSIASSAWVAQPPASDAGRPTAGRAADGRSTTGTGADRGRPTQPTRPGARPPDDQALRGRTIRR